MSKTELVELIAEQAEISKAAAARALDAALEGITTGLKKEGKVTLVGFGTFSAKKRAAREGINPLTKEPLKIPAKTVASFKAKMDEYRTSEAADAVWTLLKRSNKYIDETTPWALAKDESKKARLGTVLYNLIESIRIAAVLLSSFMPETAEKIAKQIGADNMSFESVESFGTYTAGNSVGEAEVLFARIDEAALLEQLAAQSAEDDGFEPIKEEISFDDFEKLDLRVAKVLSCEEVKKSEKLLKFELDLGGEQRTILSGIKQWYTPGDMVGKNVIIIANLKPRKIMGIESKGMILSAVDNEDNLTALTTMEEIKPGSIVG